jgi:hypothetical protein
MKDIFDFINDEDVEKKQLNIIIQCMNNIKILQKNNF